MKKALFVIIVTIMITFSSCMLGTDGEDGTSYMEVSIYSYAEAAYASVEGFPNGWSTYTYYELGEGSHYVEYALCDGQYDSSSNGYYYFINSYDLSNSYTWESSSGQASYILDSYLSSGSGYIFSNTIEIEVNEGSSGGLFTDGEDGSDKYYSLYLAWDPSNSTISSNGNELNKIATTNPDGEKLLLFEDENRTFKLTISGKKSVPMENVNTNMRSIHQ